MENKVVFIIAHKYYRGYESYLKYYINNINKFYTNALIIVVDNNSTYVDDIFNDFLDESYKNVIMIINNIESKFELGAYRVGLKHIIDNDLLNDYEYYVCSQDNFIIKNKYDFNNLKMNNITACPINSYYQDSHLSNISNKILNDLNLNNSLENITFCWCNSFIIYRNKINQLYDYLVKIQIFTRIDSEASERYMARILYELNGHKNYDIDGDIRNLNSKYDCWTINPYDNINGVFFIKKVQQKNENTKDKW